MTHRRINAASMFLLCSIASAVWAQDPQVRKPPTPEERQKAMESLFNTMAPAQAKAVEASLDAVTMYAERAEVADRVAAYKRNLFDALKKRGFTAEQALQITIATPIPSLH